MRKLYQLFATAHLGTFVRIWTKSGFPHPFGQFEHFLACMGYGWAWTRDVKNASRLRLKRSNNRVDTTELNTKVPWQLTLICPIDVPLVIKSWFWDLESFTEQCLVTDSFSFGVKIDHFQDTRYPEMDSYRPYWCSWVIRVDFRLLMHFLYWIWTKYSYYSESDG